MYGICKKEQKEKGKLSIYVLFLFKFWFKSSQHTNIYGFNNLIQSRKRSTSRLI